MKGKLAVTATLLMAGVLTAPAYAAQSSQLAATFNNQDIQSLFVDNQQPMHLAVLSPMEMKTTQGGASLQELSMANILAGGINGAVGNVAVSFGGWLHSGEFDAGSTLAGVGTGFVAGAVTNAILPGFGSLASNEYAGWISTFLGGATGGYVQNAVMSDH